MSNTVKCLALSTGFVITYVAGISRGSYYRPELLTFLQAGCAEDGMVTPAQSMYIGGNSIKELHEFLGECLKLEEQDA